MHIVEIRRGSFPLTRVDKLQKADKSLWHAVFPGGIPSRLVAGGIEQEESPWFTGGIEQEESPWFMGCCCFGKGKPTVYFRAS